MGQVRKLNENSSRRYQFYDRRIKNLLRKIHTDSREKPDKNSSEVSAGCVRKERQGGEKKNFLLRNARLYALLPPRSSSGR